MTLWLTDPPSLGLALSLATIHLAYLSGQPTRACCALRHVLGQVVGQFALAVATQMGAVEIASVLAWQLIDKLIEWLIMTGWMV